MASRRVLYMRNVSVVIIVSGALAFGKERSIRSPFKLTFAMLEETAGGNLDDGEISASLPPLRENTLTYYYTLTIRLFVIEPTAHLRGLRVLRYQIRSDSVATGLVLFLSSFKIKIGR